MSLSEGTVSASDWIKGIALSVLASIIGGASKLSIRKSWLLEHEQTLAIELAASSGEEEEGENEEAGERVKDAPQTRTLGATDSDIPCGENEESSSPRRTDKKTTVLNKVTASTLEIAEDSLREMPDTSDSSRAPAPAVLRQRSLNDEGSSHCTTNDVVASVSTSGAGEGATVNAIRSSRRMRTGARKKQLTLAYALRGAGMIGMTFLNPLCCVLAMNYASPSILAPFSGLTLVWIVLFSPVAVGEQPTARQMTAASLIVLGEVMVAAFGDHTNDEGVTIQDVHDSYLDVPFVLYFAGIALWMLLLAYWMMNTSSNVTLRKFAFGVSGGSITGLQNFLKDSLTIVKAVNHDKNAASWPWYFPLLFFLAAATAFGGLLLLTACMKLYDATYSSAMFVGSFVVSASIMSVIHYHTFEHLHSITSLVLYPAGLAVLMVGVYLLLEDAPELDVTTSQQQDCGMDHNVEDHISFSPDGIEDDLPVSRKRENLRRVGPFELQPLVKQEGESSGVLT